MTNKIILSTETYDIVDSGMILVTTQEPIFMKIKADLNQLK